MIITSDGNIPSKYAHSFNVMKMAQGFFDAGQDVTVVSLLSLPNIIEWFRIKDIYNFYGIGKNIKIKLLPVFNKDFFSKTIGARGFNEKAAFFIKKNRPGFVYCRSYLTTYHCVKSGVPSIIETHTTNYSHPDLQRIYDIAGAPDFLGLVTIHENIKEEHIKRGVTEDKILVLEDGVDLNQFNIKDDRYGWRRRLELPESKKIVLYCGSLFREKGIEDILLTAKNLASNKDIVFVIVGGTDESLRHWKKFINDNQIQNAVLTGFVNNSLVPMYLKSADVLIMPYNTGITYDRMDLNSTSPLKLFEYMASARPVVTSDIPVVSKIVKHGESAMLAEPNNIEKLSEYVMQLLNHKEKAATISKKAYEMVKQYSWTKRCEIIHSKLVSGYLPAI
jgi:glycosyltransferase involved in cell wall biosynthesis